MPLDAESLFREGRLDDAIKASSEALRSDPANSRTRSFLFELLCFAGEYARAEKQLDVLGRVGPDAQIGAMLYRAAIGAELTRQSLFREGQVEAPEEAPPISGRLNGRPFEELSDADSLVGSRFEMFVAGGYRWIHFSDIFRVEIDPPRLLRDLLWTTARVKLGPSMKDMELGEVLLPVMTPLAWEHPDDQVRLGRATAWEEKGAGIRPVGQKMLLMDEELVPLLSVRVLEFDIPSDD